MLERSVNALALDTEEKKVLKVFQNVYEDKLEILQVQENLDEFLLLFSD